MRCQTLLDRFLMRPQLVGRGDRVNQRLAASRATIHPFRRILRSLWHGSVEDCGPDGEMQTSPFQFFLFRIRDRQLPFASAVIMSIPPCLCFCLLAGLLTNFVRGRFPLEPRGPYASVIVPAEAPFEADAS